MWDNKFKYGYWIYSSSSSSSSSYTTATTTTTYTAISWLPNFGPQPPFYFHTFLCLIPIVSVLLAITLLWLSCVSMPFSFPTDTYICTYTHIHIHPHKSDWMLNSSWKELNFNTQSSQISYKLHQISKNMINYKEKVIYSYIHTIIIQVTCECSCVYIVMISQIEIP